MLVILKLKWCLCGILLFIVQQEAISIKKGYYTIVAPATIRPETIFHVSLTLNDFHKSCWFNISLKTYPYNNEIYALENIEIKPGTTKLVELHAPATNDSFGYLEVFGYNGIISKDSEIIFFETYTDKFWAFIQTDKAKYRPGELVQFRIICIDQLTRPAKLNEKISVEIYDGDYNLIMNIFDVKFVQGVFRSKLQLSEYTNLGEWTVKVRYSGGKNLAFKNFKVERYVLPKFDIEINTKGVSIYDSQMKVDISASYFYGEKIKGNLSFTMTNTYAPYLEEIPKFTKETQIDGESTIVIDLKNDLQIKSDIANQSFATLKQLYTFHLEAIVIDELSEVQSRTAIKMYIYNRPYRIDLQSPSTFDSDAILNIKVKVSITDINGNSINDTKTPIEIILECIKENKSLKDSDIIRISYKNEASKDFSILQVTNKNYTECFLYAEYQKSKSIRRYMSRKPIFDIDILTESPEEGKELKIKIVNLQPIQQFSYEIFSRGDIIQSDLIKVAGNQTTHIFGFNVTSEMIPKITIYVHLINNMNLLGKLKDVLINKTLPNSIKITTIDEETKPGKSVFINVTTDVGSYVGLMGIDRSALQSSQKISLFNDITKQLNGIKYLSFYTDIIQRGKTGDIITFSNVIPLRTSVISTGIEIEPSELPERIRILFPESWLFEDFERTAVGSFNILKTTPDSITTWVITGFSIHPENGLAFTKNTTILRVFQNFFVSFDLPSLVKDGEIIEVPVYINNYMNEDALTNVTIETNSEDLQILENPEASSKTKLNISMLISAKKREKLLIFLRPLNKGNYNVTVRAISSLASDAIRKTLNVQPQGIPYAMSKTYLVHLPEESIQENDITIDIPKNAVLGSERVEVSVVGDIFQPLMRNLEKLARVPYGNGEENMRLIVSNSIVLRYLKVLNYSNPSLENKIRENIELGYQNQLAFKYLDGSFGLFERRNERTGDIWHTVFSIWGLKQSMDFIDVDSGIIDKGLDYLKFKQQENGCFKSERDLEEDVKFTAFGLMVFLMDKNSKTRYNEVIVKGLTFLHKFTNDMEDSPISFMAAYTLLLGEHEKARDHLKKLTSKFQFTSKQSQWTKSDTLPSLIETTAASMINLLESQKIREQNILHIVKGLIVPEESSVTHMIALQAMIGFLEKLSLCRQNLNIIIKDDQDQFKEFYVNSENSQILQTFELSKSSRKLDLQSKGQGFAVVDVRYNYNVFPDDQSSLYYNTNISTKKISKHLGVLKICSSSNYTNHNQSKLTTMEVHLQSGFIFTERDFSDEETLGEYIKSIQVDNSRYKLLLNFELSANEVCIELEVRKTYKIFNSKPGWVTVYDVHNKDHKATISFSFNEME